jgi:molecular chaperone DnaJ|nr:DnaJ C-terminal domain-containing protein [Neorhizobium tomejilense]
MSPHSVLGLHFDATRDDVTAAFRRLAKGCHPDLHPNDPDATARFTVINEAYKTLLAAFDEPRDRRTTSGPNEPPTVVTVRRNVFLTVHEAMAGCRKVVEGISGPCQACSGAGRVPTEAPVECVACYGSGVSQRRQSGFIQLRLACTDCAGTGKVSWFSCHECSGFGTVHMESCEVDIPPASRSGDKLVVPGGANNREENVVGDVEITVVVKDRKFRISGNDIETSVTVEFWETVLGTTVGVELPSGDICRLAVPPETPPTGKFRIKGRGLNYTEEKGDLVVFLKTRTLKLSDPGVAQAMEILRSGGSGSAIKQS